MGDEDDRALVAFERRLELFDRLEVKMIRRLVEHEPVRALSREQSKPGSRPLPRREGGRRAQDVIGTQRELGQQGSSFAAGQSTPLAEDLEQRLATCELGPPLLELAELAKHEN